jgi:hypothetical protein
LRRAALAGALLALGASPAAALAGPPGRWTQVTGFGPPDPSTLEASLARSADGVLHVGWVRTEGPGGSVLHSAISRNARRVRGPDVVHAYAGGLNHDTAILAAPEGLRLFFAGLDDGGATSGAMATSTSATGGRTWSPAASASSTALAAGRPVYTSAGLAAARLPDGSLLSAWGAPGPALHVGLDPATADTPLFPGGAVDPGIGVDAQTGQPIVSANLLDEDGVAYAAPGGLRTVIPGSGAAQLQHPVGVTGRIGAPGVFIAYTRGSSEFLGRAAVWNVGAGRGISLGRTGDRGVGVAAAPRGRLWAFWFRTGPDAVYAARSNRQATRFGRVVRVSAPRGTDSMLELAGDGGAGPLDVLLLADRGRGPANWHQRVLPGLTLTARLAGPGRVRFRVTDAGEPVRRARVMVADGASLLTGARGTVTFALARGRYRAIAAKAGYVSASAGVRVRSSSTSTRE